MSVDLNQPLLGPFRVGQRGDGVRQVQQRLNEVLDPPAGSGIFGLGQMLGGVPGPRFVRLVADGAFGAKTSAAVVRFQKARQLKPDGIVGPITARSLGFTHYTSLQRMGMGAMQLASTITGSLARLIPAPHSEPDLAYSALVALAVQADVMRRTVGVLGGLPGLDGMAGELEQIARGVQQRLASAQSQRFLANSAKQAQDYAQSAHGRLMLLSQQLRRQAQQQATPGSPLANVAQAAIRQAELLAHQAELLRALTALGNGPFGGLGAIGGLQHQDPADGLLKIAAAFAKTASALPHL